LSTPTLILRNVRERLVELKVQTVRLEVY